jgi:hypothetical protein
MWLGKPCLHAVKSDGEAIFLLSIFSMGEMALANKPKAHRTDADGRLD